MPYNCPRYYTAGGIRPKCLPDGMPEGNGSPIHIHPRRIQTQDLGKREKDDKMRQASNHLSGLTRNTSSKNGNKSSSRSARRSLRTVESWMLRPAKTIIRFVRDASSSPPPKEQNPTVVRTIYPSTTIVAKSRVLLTTSACITKFTLNSICRSPTCMFAKATTLKASLISWKSTSPREIPAFFNASGTASEGAMVNSTGACKIDRTGRQQQSSRKGVGTDGRGGEAGGGGTGKGKRVGEGKRPVRTTPPGKSPS